MRRNIAASLLLLIVGACGGPTFNENDVQIDCEATHPKVGYTAELETHQHDVSGTVHVIDDCTLEIRNFHFDGGGVDVRVIGSTDTDFENGYTLSENLLRDAYSGETLTVSLPNGVTLDDFEHLSVWCTAAGVSFGDGQLEATP